MAASPFFKISRFLESGLKTEKSVKPSHSFQQRCVINLISRPSPKISIIKVYERVESNLFATLSKEQRTFIWETDITL